MASTIYVEAARTRKRHPTMLPVSKSRPVFSDNASHSPIFMNFVASMRPLLRPANLFILFTYLLLSAVPFMPLLFSGQTVDSPWRVLCLEVAGVDVGLGAYSSARPGSTCFCCLPFSRSPSSCICAPFMARGSRLTIWASSPKPVRRKRQSFWAAKSGCWPFHRC